ncbi:uncharacterized protein TRIVIDRAFT_222101 [Trichoderma virens Gv29-8]|uniref:Uncharacterized protein n=1 Tax=Hypocrea virens (strain Gv29-8 / FGSC 10586) TaxID=413071 RepID=G9MRX0_HYPVG|nr:uncharacterized protein TRIVIDRAFT_222101 [Trichoderma virens Gv29-8]EHK22838.1 hypothetical protein TRIVIDRAFT_222101 [Trichoderma virens Gv29-8]UKZ47893.1 hypothetical protein TrVGV298_002127 [Trichoderma virens]
MARLRGEIFVMRSLDRTSLVARVLREYSQIVGHGAQVLANDNFSSFFFGKPRRTGIQRCRQANERRVAPRRRHNADVRIVLGWPTEELSAHDPGLACGACGDAPGQSHLDGALPESQDAEL